MNLRLKILLNQIVKLNLFLIVMSSKQFAIVIQNEISNNDLLSEIERELKSEDLDYAFADNISFLAFSLSTTRKII